MTADIRETLVTLLADVTGDVDAWQLERAYQTAGGVLLNVATRLGWPAADVFLEFTLAVRALLRDNADPDARARARDRYLVLVDRVRIALDVIT